MAVESSLESSACAHFFEVNIDLFDGPIDLLLHLVKQNELPIEKISLAQVAAQYFTCIEQLRNYDLDVAGEYLVIASTLLSIKSSILLNEPVELVQNEDGEMVDPHDLLLQKLREAAVYKDVAKELGTYSFFGIDVFSSESMLPEIKPLDAPFKDHDAMLLAKAFKKLVERVSKEDPTFVIPVSNVSIVDRMMTILGQLRSSAGWLEFDVLAENIRDRGSLIGTFIALLELCKRQLIQVRQDDVFDRIYVGHGLSDESDMLPESLTSEFDAVSVEG